MRRLLLFTLLTVLMISFCSSIFAQVTVTLGDGTGTNTYTGAPAPYGTWYKNFRQQYLVLATELNDIGGGPGNINSVAFDVQNLNECTPMPNFRIRMKTTTQTALTSTFEAGTYTEVFQAAEFMPVTGWNTHTFSTPFNWDGAANLLIEVVTDLIPGNYAQNASVSLTPTTFASSLRYQSDTESAINGTTGTTTMTRSNMQLNMAALDITDLNGMTITGPTTPNVNSTVNYTVSVKNYSLTAVSNYTVKLMKTGGVEIASVPGTAINPQQTLEFTLPWTPTVIGETQLYGKVVMAGDENPANDETNYLTVNVMEAGLLVVEVGNGTGYNGTTGTPTPYGTFYKAQRQQYLYTAADMYAAGAAPGLISSMAFNVQAVNTCSAMPNYTIRLKHTDQTALTSTFEEGDYTTVVTYDSYMPTADWNMHVFSNPFFWNGGSNLIVELVTDVIPGTYTQNASVYYTPTSYNSALRFQSDTAAGSTGTTGSTSMNRANTRFFMSVSDMGSLNGTVTSGGSPLAGATVAVNQTVFTAITAADGTYNIPFVPVGAQTVTASKHGYIDVTNNVTIVEDQATTSNFV
ncbi:MAG: carboxypeptidase-like regulatory domain-containing protein, partial [Candidatus Cloacimonetes bacterium]|nr:carboxypeptidase-like regulatory domain-containing protein [Candidatus Cloacimonadota bacterium]